MTMDPKYANIGSLVRKNMNSCMDSAKVLVFVFLFLHESSRINLFFKKKKIFVDYCTYSNIFSVTPKSYSIKMFQNPERKEFFSHV